MQERLEKIFRKNAGVSSHGRKTPSSELYSHKLGIVWGYCFDVVVSHGSIMVKLIDMFSGHPIGGIDRNGQMGKWVRMGDAIDIIFMQGLPQLGDPMYILFTGISPYGSTALAFRGHSGGEVPVEAGPLQRRGIETLGSAK